MRVEDMATGSTAGLLACHLAPVNAVFVQGGARRGRDLWSVVVFLLPQKRPGGMETGSVQVGGYVRRVASGMWAV